MLAGDIAIDLECPLSDDIHRMSLVAFQKHRLAGFEVHARRLAQQRGDIVQIDLLE